MPDTRDHETMLEDAKAHSIESLEAENARLRAALTNIWEYAANAVFGGWRHHVVGVCQRALQKK